MVSGHRASAQATTGRGWVNNNAVGTPRQCQCFSVCTSQQMYDAKQWGDPLTQFAENMTQPRLTPSYYIYLCLSVCLSICLSLSLLPSRTLNRLTYFAYPTLSSISLTDPVLMPVTLNACTRFFFFFSVLPSFFLRFLILSLLLSHSFPFLLLIYRFFFLIMLNKYFSSILQMLTIRISFPNVISIRILISIRLLIYTILNVIVALFFVQVTVHACRNNVIHLCTSVGIHMQSCSIRMYMRTRIVTRRIIDGCT